MPPNNFCEWRFFVALEELRTDPLRVSNVHLFIDKLRDKDCRVLLVGDAQPFDLEVPTLYNTCFDNCLFEELLKGRSAAERRAMLRQHGITHVVIHWFEINRYLSPGNYGFTSFVTPEFVHQELVLQQDLLRPLPVEGTAPATAEIFEVVK
jgi:hypothetical protein